MSKIEVEKKFKPTKEELQALLADSYYIGSESNRNTYYDYLDLALLRKGIRLRNRNGNFELKIKLDAGGEEEIEDEKEIQKYLGIKTSIDDFIKEKGLSAIVDYVTEREKFKKGDFVIDVDKTDFGHEMCEIELIVKKKSEVKKAEGKIEKLVKKYGWEPKKVTTKGDEYLKRFNPELLERINKIKKEVKEKINYENSFSKIKMK